MYLEDISNDAKDQGIAQLHAYKGCEGNHDMSWHKVRTQPIPRLHRFQQVCEYLPAFTVTFSLGFRVWV